MYCFTYYMLHAVITHDAVIGFNTFFFWLFEYYAHIFTCTPTPT